MPIPSPNKDEEKDKFISRCVGVVKKADPNRPTNQIVAMCYTAWREDKKVKQEQDPDEERYEWVEDEGGQFTKMEKKAKTADMQVQLSKCIMVAPNIIKVVSDEVFINYNRRIPERDIALEAKLSELYKGPILGEQLKFVYMLVQDVHIKGAKIYDLMLVPRDEDET